MSAPAETPSSRAGRAAGGGTAAGAAGGGTAAEAGSGAAAVPVEVHRALVDHLRRHAVRTGDFVLKSGRRSSWFIDAKQTVCRPQGMLLVAEAMLHVLPADADAIGGLTMGADPVAFVTAAVASQRGRPLKAFSVRKEVKDHGAGGEVAGALDPGDRVVITEDAVTRGTSMAQAVRAVRRAGAEVVLAVAVVDRGGAAAGLLADDAVPFVALVGAPDLGFDYDEP